MGKTLGGNARPVTCFRGAGALGSAAEQSFGKGYQMIEVFAEKFPGLFGCDTGLASKFVAKRVSLLVKRAGSLAKSVGNTIDCFTEIALAKRLVEFVGNSLRRLIGGFRGLIPQLTCLTQHAVKCSLSLAPGGCVSGGCAAVIVQLARPVTIRQNTETGLWGCLWIKPTQKPVVQPPPAGPGRRGFDAGITYLQNSV